MHQSQINELQGKVNQIEIQRKIEDQKKKEKEDIEVRKNQTVEAGLSVLERKNELGDYTVKGFDLLEKKIENWIKKANMNIPEEQYCFIESTLKRIYPTLNKREKKEWVIFNKGVWTKIVRWTNEPIAEQWFNEMIKDD